MREVPFLPSARAEFLVTFHHYASQRQTLGADFLAEVERATHRIAAFPDHGIPYLFGTRRVVLRGFPYSNVYRAGPGEPLIVAVAHTRRKPGYWGDRL